MNNKTYKFSFTAAGALILETLVIARHQYACNDWTRTKYDVIEQNLLLKDKKSTAQRQYSEIESRLKRLNEQEISLLCNGSTEDVKSMIWLSIVKTYTFIEDFFTSVIINNYQERKKAVSDGDYYNFWESKKSISNEILTLSDNSAKKIKQVIFKMLFDLGFIDSVRNRNLIRPVLSETTERVIAVDSPHLLSLFLYDDHEIKQITSKL